MIANTAITEQDRVGLARGVRLVDDQKRGVKVLLAPERTMALDPVALSIVEAFDGKSTVGELISSLARTYDATREEIAGDVLSFVEELRKRRMIEIT
jgi:pyrroloquinoline quinone biosynthesis protein D